MQCAVDRWEELDPCLRLQPLASVCTQVYLRSVIRTLWAARHAQAFYAWRAAAQAQRGLRARLATTLCRWQHRTLGSAFASWREAAQTRAAQRQGLQVCACLKLQPYGLRDNLSAEWPFLAGVQGILLRLQHRLLFTAFSTWRENAAEQQREAGAAKQGRRMTLLKASGWLGKACFMYIAEGWT